MIPKGYPSIRNERKPMAVVPQEIQLFIEEIQYERVGIGQESRYPAKRP